MDGPNAQGSPGSSTDLRAQGIPVQRKRGAGKPRSRGADELPEGALGGIVGSDQLHDLLSLQRRHQGITPPHETSPCTRQREAVQQCTIHCCYHLAPQSIRIHRPTQGPLEQGALALRRGETISLEVDPGTAAWQPGSQVHHGLAVGGTNHAHETLGLLPAPTRHALALGPSASRTHSSAASPTSWPASSASGGRSSSPSLWAGAAVLRGAPAGLRRRD